MENKFKEEVLKLLCDEDTRGITLLKVLKKHPVLHRCYLQPLGGVDNMTLENHTSKVIECFENNFEGKSKILLDPQYFKLLLVFHDLGKPQAVFEQRFEKQHTYTTSIIKIFSKEVGFPIQTLSSIIAIINGDPIGKYLNSKFKMPLEKALREIGSMASQASVSVKNL